MSLTYVNYPTDYDSALRPVKWAVETTTVGLRAVQFKLYDTATATLIDTKIVLPNLGSSDTFSADFRQQIQTYLGFDTNLFAHSGLGVASNSLARQFYVTAAEDTNTSGAYSFGSTTSSSSYYILNNSLEIGEALPTATSHIITSNGAKHFSNRPEYITRNGDTDYTTIYNNGESVKLTIVVTDNEGATTQGVVNSIALSSKISYVGIGYNNINAYTLSTGSQPLLDANSVSYTVALQTVTTGNTFETITVNINSDSLCDVTRFLFQNKYGGPDYFSSWRFKEQTNQITSDIVAKSITDFTDTESFGFHKKSSSLSKKYKIKTQALSREMVEYLEEMISSSDVYIDNGTDYLPIAILTDSYLVSSSYVGKEVFEIEFEYITANQLRRQTK